MQNPNYIACIQGPILLTAPHSCTFVEADSYMKDGKYTSQREHARECYTSSIALGLSIEINKLLELGSSFIVWENRRTKQVNEFDLDPNYLDDD